MATPIPTSAPTLTSPQATATAQTALTELRQRQKTCWLQWAAQVDLRTLTQPLGKGLVPIGLTARLKGPGDWASAWQNKSDEVWYLSIPDLQVVDYTINGHQGRSIPGHDRGGVIVFEGTGAFCLQR